MLFRPGSQRGEADAGQQGAPVHCAAAPGVLPGLDGQRGVRGAGAATVGEAAQAADGLTAETLTCSVLLAALIAGSGQELPLARGCSLR